MMAATGFTHTSTRPNLNCSSEKQLRKRRTAATPIRGEIMSKQSKEAGDTFRPSKKPLTEYEEEQLAIRKNMERLRAERRARDAAKKDE
jgi:hypothetical protein